MSVDALHTCPITPWRTYPLRQLRRPPPLPPRRLRPLHFVLLRLR